MSAVSITVADAVQQQNTRQYGCAGAARPDDAGAHAGREGPAAGGAGAAGWTAPAAGAHGWQRQGRPARATAVAGRCGPRDADAAGDLLLKAEIIHTLFTTCVFPVVTERRHIIFVYND